MRPNDQRLASEPDAALVFTKQSHSQTSGSNAHTDGENLE